uniref:Uncharacterized protein n=1 Tax=Kwoniella bestiolae CBS 10118 TaxID=1296100 RepID=A0A1B9G141_9TREE|nr:hypothetical protein I302_06198 [Kwoniella bestiolae CBS 10118]OCF24737.1 hypothetical protein I302_06198 [Kwoniella bestiolae CBS 10118]
MSRAIPPRIEIKWVPPMPRTKSEGATELEWIHWEAKTYQINDRGLTRELTESDSELSYMTRTALGSSLSEHGDWYVKFDPKGWENGRLSMQEWREKTEIGLTLIRLVLYLTRRTRPFLSVSTKSEVKLDGWTGEDVTCGSRERESGGHNTSVVKSKSKRVTWAI